MSLQRYNELSARATALQQEIEKLQSEQQQCYHEQHQLGEHWKCDTCGAEHLEPRDGNYPPLGWHRMECRSEPWLRIGCPEHQPHVESSDDIVKYDHGRQYEPNFV